MAITESQLETWAKQGSIAGSSATYNCVKDALEASDTPYAGKDFSVFLQGSYGNDTNIYAESDVDIVIKLNSTFERDLSDLSDSQRCTYLRSHAKATYCYGDFKHDVLRVLAGAYGNGVKAGSKAIVVPACPGRRKADVIVALEFRRYLRFNDAWDQDYLEGIVFYTSTNQQIINYPKRHSKNLTEKHKASNSWLKPMVRVLKNMRSRLVGTGSLGAGDAPSYFLEGLLYNVPNNKFGSSYGDSFREAINWLNSADRAELLCANEQHYLVRSASQVCWQPSHCNKFLRAVAELWNNW